MKFGKIFAAAILASMFPALSIAQEDSGKPQGRAYFEIASSLIKVDGFGQPAATASGRIGARFLRNLGAEIEVGRAFTDITGDQRSIEIDLYGGAFMVTNLSLADNFEILGRVGYVATETSRNASLDTGNGIAGGVGGRWDFPDHKSFVRVDYLYTDIGNGAHVAGISIGRRF